MKRRNVDAVCNLKAKNKCQWDNKGVNIAANQMTGTGVYNTLTVLGPLDDWVKIFHPSETKQPLLTSNICFFYREGTFQVSSSIAQGRRTLFNDDEREKNM